MQLEEYGINLDGELISIEQTRRGKTDLRCPYCNCGLTAKKGEVKAHHFAHTEATCKAISGGHDTELLLFDLFLLHLSPKEFDALKRLNREAKIDREIARKLKQAGFITHEVISVPSVGCRNIAKITTLGQIICGTASMAAFARSQSELILDNRCQYQIGNLTEYFKLEAELAELIWQELREIEPKEIPPVERELIDGIPSQIEHQIVIKERAKHSAI
jgi:hypothetical protein